MKREATINLIRWSARLLTLLPLIAIIFITFEDYPYHYPWSSGLQSFRWSVLLYVAVIFLFAAWQWEELGILSIPCFIITFLAVVISKGIYPVGLFICCIPGILFLILAILKRSPGNSVKTQSSLHS